jgi:hypothetical protein
MDYALLSCFGRMFPDCSLATAAATSQRSSWSWNASGIVAGGQLLMLDTSDWPSDAAAFSVCSLPEILEPDAPPRYSLSPRACRGILRRAAKRGKELPPHLRRVLEAVAAHGAPTSSPAEEPPK